jgi:hypothetical protein
MDMTSTTLLKRRSFELKMLYTIFSFASGIDDHNWEKVRETLSDTVLLDSSAMGRPSREMTASDFLSYMQMASGTFQATCHSTSNFHVRQEGRKGEILFDLIALHYLPQDTGGDGCCLFRQMKLSLYLQDSGKWKITQTQTLSEQLAGNLRLMELVGKSQAERLPLAPSRNLDLIGRFFMALEQLDAAAFAALWVEGVDWRKHFQSHTPATYSWNFRNTADPDITLVAYEKRGAIFYCQDGLIARVEQYAMPD